MVRTITPRPAPPWLTPEQADRWCLTWPDARQPSWTTRRFSLSPWAHRQGRLVWPHRLGAGA